MIGPTSQTTPGDATPPAHHPREPHGRATTTPALTGHEQHRGA